MSAIEWTAARERLQGPAFEPLRTALARLPAQRWPTHEELTHAAQGVVNAGAIPVRFVAPPSASDPALHYEQRIAATGEIETRPGNWHDLFNALAWIAFPRTKARLNAQHAAILAERGPGEARRRGPERDALTLFDEGGLLVAASDPALLQLIRDFEWKALFWERRAELAASMRFFAFGHALFEKMLDPYLGIVAKSVLVAVDDAFFALPAQAQVERIDALAAAHFSERRHFATPRALPPVPVLGIPGWHRGTAEASFYDDARHFRARAPRPAARTGKMHG